MATYRLLAIDVDGTLLDGRSELRPAVRGALARAVGAGVEVLLCTGRRYRSALPVALDAGLSLPIVCHSGALVKDTASHDTLFADPIPQASFERLLDLLDRAGLVPLAYTDSYLTGVDFYVERGAVLTRYHDDYLAKNEGCYVAVESLRRDVPGAIIQTCTFGEVEHLRAAKRRVEAELGHGITNHLLTSPKYIGHFLEFQAATASKWHAVSALAARRGIPPGRIAAIGDDENDISMLRGAGLGVAMANAGAAVKNAADIVTATNEEDGVARVIERILTGAL